MEAILRIVWGVLSIVTMTVCAYVMMWWLVAVIDGLTAVSLLLGRGAFRLIRGRRTAQPRSDSSPPSDPHVWVPRLGAVVAGAGVWLSATGPRPDLACAGTELAEAQPLLLEGLKTFEADAVNVRAAEYGWIRKRSIDWLVELRETSGQSDQASAWRARRDA